MAPAPAAAWIAPHGGLHCLEVKSVDHDLEHRADTVRNVSARGDGTEVGQ
jgi:hypothetical protein